MKKKILTTFLILLVLVSFFSLGALAEGEEGGRTEALVVDKAGILTEEQVKVLNARAEGLSAKYSCEVIIYIINEFSEATISQTAEALYAEHNYGLGADRSCVMLLLSMSGRDYSIMAHGYGNTVFTDFGKGKLADSFKPAFKENDYNKGFSAYINKCAEYFEAAQQGRPVDTYTKGNIEKTQLSSKDILITVAICFAIALGIALIMRAQMKTAHIKTVAGDYICGGVLNLTSRYDHFKYDTIQRVYSPQQKDSGGGTTTNSGGFSHSSGKF